MMVVLGTTPGFEPKGNHEPTNGIGQNAYVQELEEELKETRLNLQMAVEGLETTNEELHSVNEELQSANEELETSKEDVQAANDALIRSNSDLENLLAGTEIATVFLDDYHRIKSFTPEMSRFYRILPTDIGREIGDFTTKALYMPPYPPRREIEQLGSVEAEISMENGQTYLRRIIPYKTHQGRHEGLVVTFVDISELRQSEGRFHNLANMVTAITWMATDVGKIFFFNKRWYEYTGQAVDDEAPREISSFIHPEDLDTIMDAWQSAMEKGESFRAEFRLRRHDGVYRWHQSQGEPSRDRDGKT
ncbi:MAG: PAS domain S-box protein, partial [Sphingobacteriales bacterium]